MALQLGASSWRAHSPATRRNGADHQGGAHPSRRGLHRRDLAVHRLQQPSGSTKSLDYVRAHNEAVNALDIMIGPRGHHYRLRARRGGRDHPARRPVLTLRKLNEDYDAFRPAAAMNLPARVAARGGSHRAALGRCEAVDLHGISTPWRRRSTSSTSPNCARPAALDKVNAGLR